MKNLGWVILLALFLICGIMEAEDNDTRAETTFPERVVISETPHGLAVNWEF